MKISSIPMESLAEVLKLQMDSGGEAHLVVTGDSMYPTLRHRKDVVYLTPLFKQLKKKDLILYKRENGKYILHRIVSRPNNGCFICCGDNQWEKEPVGMQQVVAIVERFVRNGKTYTVNHFGYRLWLAFWVGLFPLRRPLLVLRRAIGRLKRR